MHGAFAELEAATGIDFVYEGLTDEQLPQELSARGLVQARYGLGWVPIIVDVNPDMEPRGWARPVAFGDVIVTGSIQARPLSERSEYKTLMHELGHLAGLAHTGVHGQVMSDAGFYGLLSITGQAIFRDCCEWVLRWAA